MHVMGLAVLTIHENLFASTRYEEYRQLNDKLIKRY